LRAVGAIPQRTGGKKLHRKARHLKQGGIGVKAIIMLQNGQKSSKLSRVWHAEPHWLGTRTFTASQSKALETRRERCNHGLFCSHNADMHLNVQKISQGNASNLLAQGASCRSWSLSLPPNI